ncbi:MAG: 50S ribosomal protein L23 [Candidatus Moranbacteria bacterium]|nr:50S ribosomal protein L23 [Candidatus Moranbacteria bacterium]
MSGILNKFGFKKEQSKDSDKADKKAEVKDSAQKKSEKSPVKAKASKKTASKVSSRSKTQDKTKKKAAKPQAKDKNAEKFYRNILAKIDTEKAGLQESQGKYSFVVAKNSNKKEVEKAIESYYQVKVLKVNLINYKPKKTRFGLTQGMKKGYKKAIVSLREGEVIKD